MERSTIFNECRSSGSRRQMDTYTTRIFLHGPNEEMDRRLNKCVAVGSEKRVYNIIKIQQKIRKKNIEGTIRVHAGVIRVQVVSMLDPPDCHMGNPNMTGDSPHTGTGIVMYQIQHSVLVGWRSRLLLTSMLKDPLSDNC
ncbi:hypothetical protein TNCV_3734481 [Trichonephila clavipes]|nr:hypothetical protein TNCV_3734481 [Trichonephila clavipes]